ncbi:MAG: MltA domain-containing protein [Saprospiraceae bacterium]
MKIESTWLVLLLGTLYACEDKPTKVATNTLNPVDSLEWSEPLSETTEEEEEVVAPEWIFRQNGKIANATPISGIYQHSVLDTFDFPFVTSQIVEALDNQLKLLELTEPRRPQQVGNLVVTPQQLRETIRTLRAWQQTKPLSLHQYLDAYQIRGKDGKGNVKFTGYYTPVVKVSKKKSAEYQYPIYARPLQWQGRMPSRRDIEQGALHGLGLELAYARSRADVYRMQMQGSGFVEYANGSRELFSYSGTNRHPYRSVKRYDRKAPKADTALFRDPSYTFFTPRRTQPKGAGHVPLLEELSIAVDKRYIPLGSCLLAAFPVYDLKTRRLKHEYRLFFAQDVGGAIRGPGHVDVYRGIGPKARRKAHYLNHYGRLWLLLPKRDDAVSASY